ncbi:MAG: WG repeat-containing protein, partial [Bacteroidota bacterium]
MKTYISVLFVLLCFELNAQIAMRSYPQRKPTDNPETDHLLFGLVDTSGKMLLPYEYDGYDYLYKYYIFIKYDKKGLFDENGTMLLPCEYDKIYFLSEYYYNESYSDIIIFENSNGLKGLLNPSLNKKTELLYNNISLIDDMGKDYFIITYINPDLPDVELSGLANQDCEILLEPDYESIVFRDFENEYLYNNDPVALITQMESYPFDYSIPDNEIINYRKQGVFNLVKKEWIIQPDYLSLEINENLIKIWVADVFTIYNPNETSGNKFSIAERQWDTSTSYPLYYYVMDNSYIYTNKGSLIGPYQEINVQNTKFGFVPVKNNEKWGLVSLKTGHENIQCLYDNYIDITIINWSFDNNFVVVSCSLNDIIYQMDSTGRKIYHNTDGEIIKSAGKYGFGCYSDYSNDPDQLIETVPCVYDKIEKFITDFDTDYLRA